METFIRKELKYLISDQQKIELLKSLATNIEKEAYFESNIYSIYLDTPNFDLMRVCEGKPFFRQKVRLRSYAPVTKPSDDVFLELKKKAKGVCHKIRCEFSLEEALAFLDQPVGFDQASKELAHVLEYFPLDFCFALYAHRYSWKWKDRPDLRITIDDTLTYRTEDLSLGHSPDEKSLLPPGQNILEIKCAQNLPLKLVRTLEALSIKPVSFSKAGQVYRKCLERNSLPCSI